VSPTRSRAVPALSTFLALVLSAAVSAQQGQTTEARAIETAFSEYKTALLEENGAKAADIVSARTIAFYEGIRTQALTTPREKLSSLDFMSRLMVIRVRHEFTKAQIEQLTGRKLLAFAVDRGWISRSGVATIEQLTDIQVNGSKASASIPGGRGFPLFHFVKESGQWKLDLVASFDIGNMAMKEEIKKSGMTEDQFIVRILTMLSNRKVDDSVYSPPVK